MCVWGGGGEGLVRVSLCVSVCGGSAAVCVLNVSLVLNLTLLLLSELSHRSSDFTKIITKTEDNLRKLL